MEEWRGHLLGEESIFTFTRGCADFRDPTAVFRIIETVNQLAFFVIPARFRQESLMK
jgi:hypothetical protein